MIATRLKLIVTDIEALFKARSREAEHAAAVA
jgi:hypothetical protein